MSGEHNDAPSGSPPPPPPPPSFPPPRPLQFDQHRSPNVIYVPVMMHMPGMPWTPPPPPPSQHRQGPQGPKPKPPKPEPASASTDPAAPSALTGHCQGQGERCENSAVQEPNLQGSASSGGGPSQSPRAHTSRASPPTHLLAQRETPVERRPEPPKPEEIPLPRPLQEGPPG